MSDTLMILISFSIVALAAKDIGKAGAWLGLPLISGFLFAGVLTGPYVLGLLDKGAELHLWFVEEIALAFIAFAAGGELILHEVRHYMHRIAAIICGQTLTIVTLGTATLVTLSDFLPFTHTMSNLEVLAVSLIGAAIMLARSPSSAYAIIKELRARGPFTQTMLGVTVLSDAVVILLFAISMSFASALFAGGRLSLGLLLFLGFEIGLDIAIGIAIGQLIRFILSCNMAQYIKTFLMLASGYGIFVLANMLHDIHLGPLPIGIFSEPLLIGLVAGFVVTNYTPYRSEFHHIIENTAPVVFVFFFTLVGVSLELDVVAATWQIALAVLVVRLIGMVLGTVLGGAVVGESFRTHAVMGLTYLTQAGISVGLAKEVGSEFPGWGNDFTTMAVAGIVMNQFIGPPVLKWAIHYAGEDHSRAETPEFAGVHDVMIVGIDDQALALARQLKTHNWRVKLIDTEVQRVERLVWPEVETQLLPEFTPGALRALGIEKTETLVVMLDDEANYTLCELAYERFGVAHIVARLHDQQNLNRFLALGVLTVDPGTAIINLLDHCVRSPSATSLLLGQVVNQDVIEVVVGNRDLVGLSIRDLQLPPDTLIISIRRRGDLILSHGYTRLDWGDEVTVVGNTQSLEDVQWRFESRPST